MKTNQMIDMEACKAEAEFSMEREIPRKKLQQWRADGLMVESTHFVRVDKVVMLTMAGQAKAVELSGLPAVESETQVTTVEVHKCRPGALPRFLRAHRVDTGEVVTVQLTAPNTFGSQFRMSDRLQVTPSDIPGRFVFTGKRPMRVRI